MSRKNILFIIILIGVIVAGGILVYRLMQTSQEEKDYLSEQGIKSALALKYNKQVSKVFIDISKENPEYAAGSVKYDQPEGEGGGFLAAKVNGQWQIVYDGNGAVDCQNIKQNYQFPQEILTGYCD